MSELTGYELLRFWEESDLSQRKLAGHLGLGFNSLHGKIFRAQKSIEKRTGTLTTKEYDRVYLRGAVFDIETTDFAAGGNMDFLICTSILPLDSDDITTYKLEFSDAGNDARLLEEVIEDLYSYDILIGHNIAAFDFNWLNSRLMYHGLPRLNKRWLYYDTYQAARRLAIKAQRKSLAFLADFFRLEYIKTSVLPVHWGMINSRVEREFEEALDDIVYHCDEDVKTNRRLFDALWDYDNGGLLNLPITKKW